jgi:hypothetical protein
MQKYSLKKTFFTVYSAFQKLVSRFSQNMSSTTHLHRHSVTVRDKAKYFFLFERVCQEAATTEALFFNLFLFLLYRYTFLWLDTHFCDIFESLSL